MSEKLKDKVEISRKYRNYLFVLSIIFSHLDATCNRFNFLFQIQDYVPESVESVSGFELPPSPDSSYSWLAPDQDYAKEPPDLPAQVPLTILRMQDSDEVSSLMPPHVVLNHLFIEKGSGPQPLVALGLTHRFHSKYVTLVVYKPVYRDSNREA